MHGTGKLKSSSIPPMAWWDSMTSTINGMRSVQITLGTDVENRAAQLESSAQRDLLLFLLLALGTVAALAALALDCVRSVSTPLVELARQAREVAGSRLPQAVAAVQDGSSGAAPKPPAPLAVADKAGAEVREVADAFDRVQRSAFELATEQAVLRRNATDSLVSLGRRNQNLVRRQISFINKLEHEDADPATLANLFELDHLATRMRRNAESLLVLAGESSPALVHPALRQRRAACRAVRGRGVPPGHPAPDRARVRHRLRRRRNRPSARRVGGERAELLAAGLRRGDRGAAHQRRVSGRDRRPRFGMDTQALAEANVRLSGTASFMAEPTRFLGHFVVGALARKCGIEVRLGEAPAAGVVARVLIPAGLLTEKGVEEAPVVPAPRKAEAEQVESPETEAVASRSPPRAVRPPRAPATAWSSGRSAAVSRRR